MKRNLFVLIAATFCSIACVQNKQGKVPYMTKSNTDKYIVVDTVSVRVWYAFNALDIEDDETYLDLQRLESYTNLKHFPMTVSVNKHILPRTA